MAIDTRAVANAIKDATRGNVSEATVRIRVEAILADYLRSIGVTYESVHERRTLTTGSRTDALFGTVIIEYKKPNLLASRAEWQRAVEQLTGYLEEEATHTGLSLASYVGILIDGQNIGFVRRSGDTWSIVGPETINSNNIRLAFEYLRGLSRKPLDPQYLSEDFGPHSDVARHCIVALWQALESPSGKAEMLYKEWRNLFGQVSGYSTHQLPEFAEMEREYGINAQQDVARLLFTVHTYYALIIKLLAAELLTLVRKGLGHSFLEKIRILNNDELKLALVEMEDGGTFRNLQIENLLEGDFFSWYLDQWEDNIAYALHQVLVNLSEYEPSTSILAPERVKDLLKHLYQQLIPGTLRHDLGEFYTPDWLANLVLDKVGFAGDPATRILDPACGTGTFLIMAIGRIQEKAKQNGRNNQELLPSIIDNVVGFDLNPLAVIAARTNYILALGDLLESQTAPIVIPIFLSDSIFSPSRRDTEAGAVLSYSITTQKGIIDIDIPANIIDAGKLAPMLSEVETSVLQPDIDDSECLGRVATRLNFTPEEISAYGDYIKTLYNQIEALEMQNWNRIWTRIIKNYYASAAVGGFDIIAGNPPWLRWTRLPASYREIIKKYCVEYGLFSQDAYVGGIETDISTVLTYSAIEKWLKPGGILGFLITQTVFKSESSEGFRKFKLPDGIELQVLEVDDMVDIKPFENVQNRTAALFLRKGSPTNYPVRYIKWEKRRRVGIKQDMALDQVASITKKTDLVAMPIYPNGGPWLTVEDHLLPTTMHMIGQSSYKARKGITTDLNGVYWIEIIGRRADGKLHFRNLHTTGKHDVASYEGLIEPDLVYPLVRGRDAKPFYIENSNIYVIVPQDGMRGYPESRMISAYPQALDYFRHYRNQLQARSSYRRYHLARDGSELSPYYSIWNVGPYTFSPHKVAWREVQDPSRFFATYIGPKVDSFLGEVTTMPDHKLYFVPCETAEEAHYLCGFLNSEAVRAFVAGYVIGTQIATHITEYIRVPTFDSSNPQHTKLASLAALIQDEKRPASASELASIEDIVESLLAN